MALLRRLSRVIFESPLGALVVVASLALTAYVVSAPLFAARYPPITDLPFHASNASILRHYWDPSWHLREQFRLQPLVVPYLSHYVLGALLMLVFPMLTALKIATAILLAMMPIGMGVLLHGMKRSPLGALMTLPLVYSTLTHWGFINFVGALGLFAMCIGLGMLVVDKPTRGRRIGLSLALLALYGTHLFRFPMAIVAVLGAALFLYPATRRFRPILLPMVPSLVLFVVWFFVRPEVIDPGRAVLKLDLAKRSELFTLPFSGFNDPEEKRLAEAFARVAAFVGVASLAAIFAEGRWPSRTLREARFSIGAAVLVVSVTATLLGLFFVLPMEIGIWWYVYPREATAVAYMAVATLPGLPRSLIAKVPLLAALAIPVVGYARFVTQRYAEFDGLTADFDRMIAHIPKAPKLLYLVFDHSGSSRATTPFLHLPAYVQADRGGWLSFHFVLLGSAPLAYRDRSEPGAVLPPKTPLQWEWMPQRFTMAKYGPFFDWFLVRSATSPEGLFREDPRVKLVDHAGKWWLYSRAQPKGAGEGPRPPGQ